MKPRIKWGLITGGVIALLNLCGGILIRTINNCFIFLTVLIGSAIAGYLCGKQEPANERVLGGAMAGGIIGVISLISQLVGGILGGLMGSGIVYLVRSSVRDASSQFLSGTLIGFVIIIGASLVVGIIMTAVGAGIGALAAQLAGQQGEVNP